MANKEQWRHWQAQKNRKLLVVPGRELLVVSHNHKHARHQRQQHRHIRWPWLPRRQRQQPARQEHQQRQSCQSGVCCAARTAGSGPVSLAAWLPLLLLATATGLRALLFERCAALRSGPDALLAAWAVMPRRGRRGTKQRCTAAAGPPAVVLRAAALLRLAMAARRGDKEAQGFESGRHYGLGGGRVGCASGSWRERRPPAALRCCWGPAHPLHKPWTLAASSRGGMGGPGGSTHHTEGSEREAAPARPDCAATAATQGVPERTGVGPSGW